MSRTKGGDGLLPLDKPPGPTSHDLVVRARRALGIRRVGHTGTLDPFASGLLLLLLGRSTRLAEYLDGLPKAYRAEARLGRRTTTDDPEGEIVSESSAWRELDPIRIARALEGFLGEGLQRPPPYSAKKVAGEPAHRRIRRGEAVELPPVPVTIHEVRLDAVELPTIRFRVRCSTGTYVRALVRDLGEELGVGAHLTGLRRTGIGSFRVEDALDPAHLGDPGAVEAHRIPPLAALAHLPRVDASPEDARRLEAGQALPWGDENRVPDGSRVAVALEGRLLAVAIREGGRLRPGKVFPLG